jgi:hypothetical protein
MTIMSDDVAAARAATSFGQLALPRPIGACIKAATRGAI